MIGNCRGQIWVLSSHLPGGTEQYQKRLVSVPAEIRNENLPNTNVRLPLHQSVQYPLILIEDWKLCGRKEL
jgi:hypothetical protein